MSDEVKLSEKLKQDHECGDFGQALKGYSEQAAALEKEAEELRAYKLPCDVIVSPATTIRKGCGLGTLIECIKNRGNSKARYSSYGPDPDSAASDGFDY